MTVRPIPCYEVACDEPGCTITTGTYGEYSGWGDVGVALDDWRDSDNQVAGDKHYCDHHRRPACVDCDTTVDVKEDEPGGDLYCPSCMPHIAAVATSTTTTEGHES